MPEVFRNPLPNWRFRVFPTDTVSIVSAVFLALSQTVVLQITERIDLLLTGGTAAPTSVFVVPLFETTAVFFFGLMGAIVVFMLDPIVSNLTQSAPLAPMFFITDSLHTVSLFLMVWAFKSRNRGFKFWEFMLITQIAGMLDVLPFVWSSLVIFELPAAVNIGIYLIHQAGFFVGDVAAWVLIKRLFRAGMVPTAIEDDTLLRSASA